MASLTTTILQDRFRGTLLGAFIGDALGAPVELLSASDIAIDPLFAKTGVRDMVSQLQLQSWIDKAAMLGMTMTDLAASNPTRPAGHYTDDTLLLFSLAEAIIASNGNPPDNATAASCAVAAWRENEKSSLAGLRGFGSGTQQVIEALAAGTVSPDTSGTMARPEGSNRNGGPMRIAPIGLIFANRDLNDMEVVKELRMAVTEAIRATHDNVEAVDGAVAVAYVVARAASSMDFNEMKADGRKLLTFLATEVCVTESCRRIFATLAEKWTSVETSTTFDWNCTEHALDVATLNAAGVSFPGDGFTAIGGAATAIWMALKYGENVEEAMVRSIALGGDTDTLCCMCGAIVGAGHGWDSGRKFPATWVAALENGSRGRDFALALADELNKSVTKANLEKCAETKEDGAAELSSFQVRVDIFGGGVTQPFYTVHPLDTIVEFKQQVEIRERLQMDQWHFISKGQILDSSRSWFSYGITSGCTSVHCVINTGTIKKYADGSYEFKNMNKKV